MKTSYLNARTVAMVKPLTVEKRNGANGEFESKTILFRIAVDRDYKTTRTENGKTISEYPTDFWLAKATGAVAQALADNCTATKEDGKLVSRHLLLNGNFEKYNSVRKQKVSLQTQANINGQIYQLNLVDVEADVQQDNTIFVIDSFMFLDKKPETAKPANQNVSVANVSSVTPVPIPGGNPQIQQPVQNVAQPTQLPPSNIDYAQYQAVMQQMAAQQAAAQQAQATTQNPAVQMQPVANLTTQPLSVPENFMINGKEPPF